VLAYKGSKSRLVVVSMVRRSLAQNGHVKVEYLYIPYGLTLTTLTAQQKPSTVFLASKSGYSKEKLFLDKKKRLPPQQHGNVNRVVVNNAVVSNLKTALTRGNG
jgi:hypothetical protein